MDAQAYALRHRRLGWWFLLLFLSLGLVLEALHGFKIGWYLDVDNETRRLMWTLAHAHGTLFSLIHLAFSATACRPDGGTVGGTGDWRRWASALLIAGTLLLPGGFFLGGLFIYGGDPGLGIFLVPAGALMIWTAVFLIARNGTSEN